MLLFSMPVLVILDSWTKNKNKFDCSGIDPYLRSYPQESCLHRPRKMTNTTGYFLFCGFAISNADVCHHNSIIGNYVLGMFFVFIMP